MEKVRFSVFGYEDGHPPLERVVAAEHDELVWLFDFYEAEQALYNLVTRPPEVLVINPRYARFLPRFRLVMQPYTRIIMVAHPFGYDRINLGSAQ